MKSKLFYLDLAVCSVWMLSLMGVRGLWTDSVFVLSVLVILCRFVILHSLVHKEKRSWLPLLAYIPLTAVFLVKCRHNGIADILDYTYALTKLEFTVSLRRIIGMSLVLWLLVLPYICYLYMLVRRQLVRTGLTWCELSGAILWHGRFEKTVSAMLSITIVTFLAGRPMNMSLCMVMCLMAVPLTYWLLCRYHRVKADKLWVLVIAMGIFWYSQIFAGAWRALMLLASFGLVAYVGTRLYRYIRNSLQVNAFVLYAGIILPSFAIGYNQYACMNYARDGFQGCYPYSGIIYITDDTHQLYGLRDRYGLIIEPEYERIQEYYNVDDFVYLYILQKDGYNRYYNIFSNKYVYEPDIQPQLQHEVRKILEDYFTGHGSGHDDKGHITVTGLSEGKTIADVRITMDGIPYLNYSGENFLAEDSVWLSSGEFLRNDSVRVGYSVKRSLSYAVNVPDDTSARYRIYVRLATDDAPSEAVLRELADSVSAAIR